MSRLIIWTMIFAGLACGPVRGQVDPPAADPDRAVSIASRWSHNAIRPGETAVLAVTLEIAPGLHLNAHEVSDPMLVPTKVDVQSPEGLGVGEPIHPPGEDKAFAFVDPPLSVYEANVRVLVPVTADEDAAAGERRVTIKASWQACTDRECFLPDQRTVQTTIVVADPDAVANVIDAALMAAYTSATGEPPGAPTPESATLEPAKARAEFDFLGTRFDVAGAGWAGVAMVSLLALVAGVLLNFTPCVLPVVPIKVISLQQHADDRRRAVLLGLSFSAGIVACFAVLGLLAFGLVVGVERMQWGQMFSIPWVSATFGAIVALLGLGMMGLFTTGLPKWVYAVNPKLDTHTGSFLFGVLTAVLSTPCTAPLFPGAMFWAITQPPAVGMAVFVAAGVGMALPYQLLLINPRWLDRLPRTGPGSELIKQVMGLLLVAVALFFFGQMGKGLGWWGPTYWWLVQDGIVIAMAWLAIRTFQITPKWNWRIAALGVTLLGTLGGLYLGHTFGQPASPAAAGPAQKASGGWRTFSPEAFAEARAAGKIVVLEFTADWCLNCKALEAAVLRTDAVTSRLFAEDVAAIRIDLTSRANQAGWDKLAQLGSRGIPLTAIYHPGQDKPILLSSIYTAQSLLDAIDQR